MKALLAASLLAIAATVTASALYRHASADLLNPAAEAGAVTPVVVELFTSEGCSSCPAADAVLTKIAATQPVNGANVIAIGEHVDYWDHLGWRDAFSSAALTSRQSRYSNILRQEAIYTPQMVVNGTREFVGSDYAAAIKAIAAEAKSPVRRVTISLSSSAGSAADGADGSSVPLSLRVEPSAGEHFAADLDLVVVVTEDGIATKVGSGENGGRVLRHSAVARTLSTITQLKHGTAAWSGSHTVRLGPSWKRPALSIVVFTQEPSTHRITGASILKL
jgi:hypothetical protein